jgi:hypothetical protein
VWRARLPSRDWRHNSLESDQVARLFGALLGACDPDLQFLLAMAARCVSPKQHTATKTRPEANPRTQKGRGGSTLLQMER